MQILVHVCRQILVISLSFCSASSLFYGAILLLRCAKLAQSFVATPWFFFTVYINKHPPDNIIMELYYISLVTRLEERTQKRKIHSDKFTPQKHFQEREVKIHSQIYESMIKDWWWTLRTTKMKTTASMVEGDIIFRKRQMIG